MARENGTSELYHDDTRLELHILEYNVRMATIEKDAIANYTHYLIKVALLPTSRPGFFSFTETKEDYSLTLEEEAFQELPKSSGLSCSDCSWNVLTVSAGAMDTGFAMGISKIVNSIIRPLADNGVSLFCMSTYQGDFILVKQQDLATAIRCLSGRFKIFDEGGYHNLCPAINNFESRFSDYDSADNHSHPLVHSIVSPLNKFHIISLNSQHFQSLIPTLIDLMFYSSTRTPPLDGHETFFHFSLVDGDLSVVLDDKDLARIPSNYFYTSSGREQWRIIKIGDYPLGYDEYGVVAQIAEPLVEAKITTFYISSCHLGNTLIPDEDIDTALDILNERRKLAQVTQD